MSIWRDVREYGVWFTVADHVEHLYGRAICRVFGRFTWFSHTGRSCRGYQACFERMVEHNRRRSQ